MKKKIIAIFLLVAMLVSCFSYVHINASVAGATVKEHKASEESDDTIKNYNRYYYEQLDSKAKKIYEAMEKMNETGLLKTGKSDIDLVENGYVTEEDAVAYTTGNSELLQAMGAARDAFQADHPEIFYVDFAYLSLRVTKSANGSYHAYLGTGRSDNYFTEGFKSEEEVEEALTEFNAKVESVVAGAKNAYTEAENDVNSTTDPVEAEIKYVHDYLTNNTSYRMEGLCTQGYEGFISTSYGSLVKNQAICGGYARAFKVILDKLEIPCLLVSGVAQTTENNAQSHLWNYVMYKDAWYGVDVTFDDPVNPALSEDDYDLTDGTISKTAGKDGFENWEYYLSNATKMNKSHIPSGYMSSVNFEFTYPELATEETGFDTIISTKGLEVEYNENGFYTTDDGQTLQTGVYTISYNGKGYYNAAKEGKYILGKFYYADKNAVTSVTGDTTVTIANSNYEVKSGEWGYLNFEAYGYTYNSETGACDGVDNFNDDGTKITYYAIGCVAAEFAVTDIAPATPNSDWTSVEQVKTATTYLGDPLLFEAETGLMYNGNGGTYLSAPFATTVSPSTSGRLVIGSTYPVSITYDEDLKVTDTLGYTIVCTATDGRSTTGAVYAKVENIKLLEDNRTVTFDFTPSEAYTDNTVCYDIQITGLVGMASNKVPNSVRYACSYGCKAFAYTAQGYDWNVFGQPKLLENVNLDTTNWEAADTTAISGVAKDRLVLVAQQTSDAQDKQMNEMIEEKFEEEILASETYNINLTLCKSQVLKTGDGVRVSIGFPEGYSADSEGVTFKAYHFTKNAAGETTGIEPIKCVVTKYGLIITCDSFSPFAVVAVEGENENNVKQIEVTNDANGTVVADKEIKNGVISLLEGETVTFTITPNENYQIDTVNYANTQNLSVDENGIGTLVVSYDDFESTNIAEVLDVNFVAKSVVDKLAEDEELVPVALANVTSTEFVTELKLTDVKSNLEDVEATSDDTQSEEVSKALEVHQGDTVEVTFSITDLKDIDEVLTVISGVLDYDSNVLEFVETTGLNNWSKVDNTDTNAIKFVSDNNNYDAENKAFKMNNSDILKITFNVKQSGTTVVTMKDIQGAYNEKIYTAQDAILVLNILEQKDNNGDNKGEEQDSTEPVKEVSSDTYTIEESVNYISKISTSTSVDAFKDKITLKGVSVSKFQKYNKETSEYEDITDTANTIVATGMKMILSDNTEYTLVVTGDCDGDGVISANDLAALKLHYIGKTSLTGAYLKAGNVDVSEDGAISIIDIAQIKLVIVGLKTLN